MIEKNSYLEVEAEAAGRTGEGDGVLEAVAVEVGGKRAGRC